ncbi:MAG: 50S ribosomal protein L11 methyltransferase [Lachnospiraceae bacterium]
MKWTKIRIKTITEAEDIIISSLYDLGLEGAQIEDNIPLSPLEKEQMFVDILPETKEDDGIAYLNFFVEEENTNHIEELIGAVKEELENIRTFMEIGEGTVEVSLTDDVDWINNWKEFFHQFYIDDILVIPSWEKIEEKKEDQLVLHIDPGTAFGTGMHETTQLCIKSLRKYIGSTTNVLDVGTGSGILSILSILFGAEKCIGTDLDICTIDAVKENMINNGIKEEQFELKIGNIIDDIQLQQTLQLEQFGVVVANILAEVLVPLTKSIAPLLKKDTIYITSGIIDDKEALVKECMIENGFTILEVNYQGEWVSITAKK